MYIVDSCAFIYNDQAYAVKVTRELVLLTDNDKLVGFELSANIERYDTRRI